MRPRESWVVPLRLSDPNEQFSEHKSWLCEEAIVVAHRSNPFFSMHSLVDLVFGNLAKMSISFCFLPLSAFFYIYCWYSFLCSSVEKPTVNKTQTTLIISSRKFWHISRVLFFSFLYVTFSPPFVEQNHIVLYCKQISNWVVCFVGSLFFF